MIQLVTATTPAAGAAINAGAPYGADYGSYGIDPAVPAGNAPGAHDPADQRLAVEGKGQLAASHAPGKTGGQHHGGKAGAIGHAGAPRR